MLRTYLSWFISASLNASSCCFCLLFIATEIIDDALIAPAAPGKEGYQKNKNYLKGFRFSTLSSPRLSIHHFTMVSTKNCHSYYINAILGRLRIELAKIKRDNGTWKTEMVYLESITGSKSFTNKSETD